MSEEKFSLKYLKNPRLWAIAFLYIIAWIVFIGVFVAQKWDQSTYYSLIITFKFFQPSGPATSTASDFFQMFSSIRDYLNNSLISQDLKELMASIFWGIANLFVFVYSIGYVGYSCAGILSICL